MSIINKTCPICMGFLRPNEVSPKYYYCHCGVRVYMKQIITLEDLLTSSGKYPERLQSKELTDTIKSNGIKLLNKVNPFLEELGISIAKVSSGFRPSDVNKKIPNAAKASLHQSGFAIDIVDDSKQSLCKLIESKPELLKKYSLWMEHPDATKGWTHLDCSESRADRPIRIFKP